MADFSTSERVRILSLPTGFGRSVITLIEVNFFDSSRDSRVVLAYLSEPKNMILCMSIILALTYHCMIVAHALCTTRALLRPFIGPRLC